MTENVEHNESMDETQILVEPPARYCCHLLGERVARQGNCVGLLVGCGEGDEVLYLSRAFCSRRIVGVDLNPNFSLLARKEAQLVVSDAKQLPFAADSFDFAAAIHSLEHLGDPKLALAEVRRVLRPGAWFYLGVPNKKRLLGYLGSSNVSLWQKIIWNAIDYHERLRGRFKNELGAHAGFTSKELERLLGSYFDNVQILTGSYLKFRYGGRLPGPLLDILLAPRIINYSAPAHYALCQKK